MKFLINTLTHWDEPPRARHYVTNTLAENHEVVFVAANKVGMPCLRENQVNSNLKIITPYFPVDHRIRYRIPLLNELYQAWLYRKLSREYQAYKIINFDFSATRIHAFFKDVIYYCNDNFYEISKSINPLPIARYHRWCESRVASKARFCVGVSSAIKNELVKFNHRAYIIPLGSPDIDKYNLAIRKEPSESRIIKVGLVAVIKNLFISSHIINLILEDESISLSLIGPMENGYLNQIPKKNNLTIHDCLTGKDLYEKLNEFDVGIAPYCVNSVMNISPGTGSKIYHYFSVGKPVVISDMCGLSELNLPPGQIYIAQQEEDFPDLIHKAHIENSPEKIRQRIDYAKANTWNCRMEKLIEYYNETK